MLVTSLRALRTLMMLAGLATALHFLFVEYSLVGLAISLLLALAAGVQLAVSYGRARTGSVFDDEREFFTRIMRVEEPVTQRRMRDLMRWSDETPGTVLMRQGDPEPAFIYVASGSAEAVTDGVSVGVCGPGHFLGEMSLVSGETASATVTASKAMRVARFDRDALAQLSRSIPEIRTAFDAALNRGLAAKLRRMNQASSRDGTSASDTATS